MVPKVKSMLCERPKEKMLRHSRETQLKQFSRSFSVKDEVKSKKWHATVQFGKRKVKDRTAKW